MFGLLLFLSCGADKSQLKSQPNKESVRIVNTYPKKPEDPSEESFSEEAPIKSDMNKAKKDLQCIKSFLADQNQAPADWEQPKFDKYESDDCNSQYKE